MNLKSSIAMRLPGYAALLACCLCASAFAEEQITISPAPHAPAIDDQIQEQENINAVPGNASLTDDSQWSDQRAATIKDVTDYIPGVIAQPHDGAESDRLSVRGSGLTDYFQGRGLLVMQDGIPINTADGEFEFPAIDPWLIKYAEVFPGADALQYGASTFGGAVNFVTPTGLTDSGYDLHGEGGSFATLHGQASLGRAWSTGDLFASASGFSQDGYRAQNEQDTSRFNANLGWEASGDFTNRVYVSHTHSDAEIPGAISLAEIAQSPRLANPLNLAGNYQRDLDITRLADKSAWADGPDRIDSAFYYTYRMLDNPVTTYEFQHNNDVGMLEKYTHTFGLSQWMVGINSYYGMADETRFTNKNAMPGALILNRNLYALTSEAYAQYDQHLAGKLFAVAGAQGSYDIRDIHQGYPSIASQNERYTGFNPKIGLRYDIAYETQAYTNLSHSFEPPSWNELSGGNSPGFNDLKAQTATTAEIGTRGLYDGVHWQAAYYHGWVRNEFVDYLYPDGMTATINAPRTKKDGIELGINGDAARNLWADKDAIAIRAAYSWNHFTLDHDAVYGDNHLPGVPENYIRAEIMYRHPSGVSFGPNVEWSPTPSPVDLTNTLYAHAYAIYGLRALWESEDRRLSFYVEGRNLLDKSYIATTNVVPNADGMDGRYFYPGEGRAMYAGVHWKL